MLRRNDIVRHLAVTRSSHYKKPVGGNPMANELEVKKLEKDWAENPRWKNVKRDYSAEDVVRLRGSVEIEHTLARRGAEKLCCRPGPGGRRARLGGDPAGCVRSARARRRGRGFAEPGPVARRRDPDLGRGRPRPDEPRRRAQAGAR